MRRRHSEEDVANEVALVFLNEWLTDNGYESITMEEANSGRQSDIY